MDAAVVGCDTMDQYKGFVKEAKRRDVPDIMELHHKNLFRTSHQFQIQLVHFVSLLRISWVCAEEEAAKEAVVDLSSRIVRI